MKLERDVEVRGEGQEAMLPILVLELSSWVI